MDKTLRVARTEFLNLIRTKAFIVSVVLMPVFKDGRHLAWTAMFGHMSDNGGMVPGSIPVKASSIYQEGIRIPPTKLYKKGEV